MVNKKNTIDKNATYDILGDFNINPTDTQCYIMPSTISDHFHVILSRSTIKQKSKK